MTATATPQNLSSLSDEMLAHYYEMACERAVTANYNGDTAAEATADAEVDRVVDELMTRGLA